MTNLHLLKARYAARKRIQTQTRITLAMSMLAGLCAALSGVGCVLLSVLVAVQP